MTESLTIGICTHKRPAMLDRLLGCLHRQLLGDEVQVVLVVVDNDPAQSAKPVLDAWTPRFSWTVSYFHLPNPNISLARNQVLALAQGDWLLLIDDDQYPENVGWVRHMLDAANRMNADVVFGPILPVYDAGAPRWIVAGHFFDQPRYATGTAVGVHIARGGNVIIRRACLPQVPEPFSVRYGKTGGEDSLFFRELEERGCRIVWDDEAVIHETVPADRATVQWLLKRQYRIGQTFIRTQGEGKAPWQRRLMYGRLGVRAFVFMLVSALMVVISLPLCSRTLTLSWMRKLVLQIGKLTSFFGLSYVEYK